MKCSRGVREGGRSSRSELSLSAAVAENEICAGFDLTKTLPATPLLSTLEAPREPQFGL
eukprot:m.220151 g.220151  ORF g.220151 m.220151 type:complete len:59 (-) comp15592_c0_seq2:47-223(-)